MFDILSIYKIIINSYAVICKTDDFINSFYNWIEIEFTHDHDAAHGACNICDMAMQTK